MDIEALRRGAEAPVQATAADLPAVAADLADAFADDVMFDWFLRADDRRDAARLKFFAFIVRHMAFPAGRIERPAVGRRGGRLDALRIPRSDAADHRAARPAHAAFRHRSRPLLPAGGGSRRHGQAPPDGPSARLSVVPGRGPAAQGHGIGSRLLKVGTDRLDATGLPAYLETQTERNIALYRRHGFEVISENRPQPGAPPLWSMWREPVAVEP